MKTVVFDNGVDIEGIKNVFNIWIDNFKKSVLDEEFKEDSGSTGSSKIIEDGDKLTFKFTTDFYVKISNSQRKRKTKLKVPLMWIVILNWMMRKTMKRERVNEKIHGLLQEEEN